MHGTTSLIKTIMNLSGFIKAGNLFADRALRTSSGMCPVGYLTLKVEAIFQSENFGEETSRENFKLLAPELFF